jgi:hypothetical protein
MLSFPVNHTAVNPFWMFEQRIAKNRDFFFKFESMPHLFWGEWESQNVVHGHLNMFLVAIPFSFLVRTCLAHF